MIALYTYAAFEFSQKKDFWRNRFKNCTYDALKRSLQRQLTRFWNTALFTRCPACDLRATLE